ncbi:universal stress protein [Albibacterium bauzanense]|uniref:Nucleotide-binding universal stress UspA family protein n=1 Tax=Albibacterium bauzanense TaxID=653929 RepID=A0A4R1M000_9SPHI|nr:universal stress protein [Albibacterium bauzanense]TCK85188.1 nucleotide-binding universal stress UspA family protein [Albibacterium bauzanense]
MKTILVPTDFSKDATEAANYAAQLGKYVGASRIVLLNSFYVSIYESILPSVNFIQLSNEEICQKQESLLRRLRALKARLELLVDGSNITIDYHLSNLPLLRAIQQTIEEQEIDLVIIGSTGENAKEDSVLGRNTIGIAKTSTIPVIVCPSQTKFTPIKKVVLACDFKKVTDTIPLNELEEILNITKAELLVLNVDPHGHHLKPEAVSEVSALQQMLKGFNPQYHYTDDMDTIDSIIQFTDTQEAQLIIALPKRYSFLQGLVHNSISQRLALNSKTPVLILK